MIIDESNWNQSEETDVGTKNARELAITYGNIGDRDKTLLMLRQLKR